MGKRDESQETGTRKDNSTNWQQEINSGTVLAQSVLTHGERRMFREKEQISQYVAKLHKYCHSVSRTKGECSHHSGDTVENVNASGRNCVKPRSLSTEAKRTMQQCTLCIANQEQDNLNTNSNPNDFVAFYVSEEVEIEKRRKSPPHRSMETPSSWRKWLKQRIRLRLFLMPVLEMETPSTRAVKCRKIRALELAGFNKPGINFRCYFNNSWLLYIFLPFRFFLLYNERGKGIFLAPYSDWHLSHYIRLLLVVRSSGSESETPEEAYRKCSGATALRLA